MSGLIRYALKEFKNIDAEYSQNKKEKENLINK
jgi:hypothetical protein